MNEGLSSHTIADERDYQKSDRWWTETKHMINRGSREFWARRGKTDEAEFGIHAVMRAETQASMSRSAGGRRALRETA